MRPTHHLQRLACAAALVLSLMLACSAVVAPPARASARRAQSDSASLTLTNGTTFTYDSTPAPNFQVVVTLATPESANRIFQIKVQLENGQQFIGEPPSTSADLLTYTWGVSASSDSTGQLLAAGSHTATAFFTNPDTGVTTQSGSVSFTVARKNFSMGCQFPGSTLFMLKPGVQAQLTLSLEYVSGPPVNWTEGTASVTFTGPSTITEQSLHPDSSGVITVTTPAVVGRYNFDCRFSGSADYAASEIAWTTYPLLISEMSQLGGMQLYSNPTTFVGTKTMQLYIVFRAAPGLPTPTGGYSIFFGTTSPFFVRDLTIGPNGDSLVTLQPNPNFTGAPEIDIRYYGDAYYDDQTYKFPPTNPAIPSGSGGSGGKVSSGGGGSPAKPKATATTTASATSTVTATATTTPAATATPASGHAILSATTSPLGGSVGLALLAALIGLLVVGGGIGGVVFWRSRRRAASLAMASASPTRSPLDEDTLPDSAPDR